jgi:hypothetical protein
MEIGLNGDDTAGKSEIADTASLSIVDRIALCAGGDTRMREKYFTLSRVLGNVREDKRDREPSVDSSFSPRTYILARCRESFSRTSWSTARLDNVP